MSVDITRAPNKGGW